MAVRPTPVRLAITTLALGFLLCGCATDHGPGVPDSATDALDCSGPSYLEGSGNYDTGPESVQGDPREAVDDWLSEEGFGSPDVDYAESARHGDRALFTWTAESAVLGAVVVRDGTAGTDGDHGWGVSSYALCDPAAWPATVSDATGIQVWTDATGHRVPSTAVHSEPGPEHCDWQEMTFLFLGKDGADGEFYGNPDDELRDYLTVPYLAHTALPTDARDTGYRRDGRELWLAADGSAAYVVPADGDAERWPAPTDTPIRCG